MFSCPADLRIRHARPAVVRFGGAVCVPLYGWICLWNRRIDHRCVRRELCIYVPVFQTELCDHRIPADLRCHAGCGLQRQRPDDPDQETGADPVSFEKRREKSKAEKISSHTAIEEEIHFVEERAVPFQRKRVSPFKEGAYPDRETEPWIPKEVPQTDSGQTNTEITTKTTAESTQKNTTEIGNGYRDNPILSYQAAEEQFKDQIDYDAIWIDRPFDRKLLNEIVGLAVDVLTSNAKTIRVNQEERPLGIVQGMYKKLDKFTVEYVIDSIKQCTRKANNIRAVLLTALYNATLTANSYISNLFAYQEAIPQT